MSHGSYEFGYVWLLVTSNFSDCAYKWGTIVALKERFEWGWDFFPIFRYMLSDGFLFSNSNSSLKSDCAEIIVFWRSI